MNDQPAQGAAQPEVVEEQPAQGAGQMETVTERVFDDTLKKAFDFEADFTKQLIALSTGVVALTITFSKDILAASKSTASGSSTVVGIPFEVTGWLFGALLLFIVSIFCGIFCYSQIVVVLEKKTEKLAINNWKILVPSWIQLGSFGIAMFFTTIYAWQYIHFVPK